MSKFWQIYAWGTIIISFGFLFLVGFWLLYPYKTVTFKNSPFPVDKKVYKVGDTLIYKAEYCKYSNINPTVTRYFNDGIVYMLSSNPAFIKPTGCSVANVQIKVPDTLLPDTYKIQINYSYKVNPIRTVDVQAETDRFEITK